MKKTSTRLIAFVLAASFFLFVSAEWSPQGQDPNDQFNIEKPEYYDGMITIKLKEGYGDFGRQQGKVSMSIASMDERFQKYEVNTLEKRFRYDPRELRDDLPDLSRIYKVSFPAKYSVFQVSRDFSSDPAVEYAEPIPIMYPDDEPDDMRYNECQHLPQIFAPQAWDIHHGEDGAEVIIAVIDNGVDWHHVDLAANIDQNLGEDADGDGMTLVKIGGLWVFDPDDINGIDDDWNGYADDLIGWDFGAGNNDPNHNSGEDHGTHCAGIAAGRTNNGEGIASISWNVKIMPLQVTTPAGDFTYAYDGIIYAAQNGADVITNSWGGAYSQAGDDAIQFARGHGCIINASAGNANAILPHYPSDYRGVVSVAALNVDDTRAWYSSYGPAVDISAPGGGFEGGILSTLPGNTYGLMSGTSMSSPLIAGCLAFLKSYHPDWTSDQIVEQLIGTADNIDSLNADFLYLLGSGRVNAYRFLTETNVSAPQEFKLELAEFIPLDENGNQVCEAGEEVILNLVLRNFSHYVGEEDVLATITTDDQDIVILQGSAVVDILPDDNFAIENQFVVKIDSNATSKFSEFTLHFGSSIPVVYGQDLTFPLLVAPSGIFIFEGNVPDQEYSGTCIAEVLDHLGMDYTFYNDYPATLLGFETVFLSHGNFGSTLANGHMYTEAHSLLVQEFLEAGGNLYIDMGGMFAGSAYFAYSNLVEIMDLFGVTNMAPPEGQDPVDSLFGSPGNIFEEIVFTGSDQPLSWYIDDLQIDETVASVPFQEKNKGNVSVMREDTVDHDYRAMYFGYSLGELIDRDAVNSRKNVILELLEFFNYELPEGYVLANFLNDKAGGGIPLEVNFSDISITHPDYMISSWAWDFDSDGTIDSYDQNPTWTYNDLGTFDVTLIVSNGQSTDTLVREELIRINFGYLVYDGAPGELGYSGSFLKDYFEENGSHVTYLEEFPEVLDGFTAVFLCFGNFGYNHTVFDDRKADIVLDYLENSGYVYLEGGDALGFDQAGHGDLLAMFGVVSAEDGGFNEIDSLGGHPDALTSGMLFTSSSQLSNSYIDTYEPDEDAQVAFTESNYGNVAVQYEGDKDQRTFCFSYALADLDDGEFPNTREELLRRICEFFDIYTGSGEMQNDAFEAKLFPNPVNQAAMIQYELADDVHVSVKIFDITGKEVATLVEGHQGPGQHTAPVHAIKLSPGIYLYSIIAGPATASGKFIVAE